MKQEIKQLFDEITANEELKKKTYENLLGRIQQNSLKKKTDYPKILSFAAVFLLFLFVGLGGRNYYYGAASYISMDVNPSIELALNRFDFVVKVTAYNEEGNAIIQNLKLNHKPYDKVVKTLIDSEDLKKYIAKEGIISFTVQADNNSKEELLLKKLDLLTQNESYQTQCHKADKNTLQEAHDHHMSFGKYQIYQELKELDPDVTVQDCEDLSVNEILNRISHCQNDSSSDSSSHHHHNNHED